MNEPSFTSRKHSGPVTPKILVAGGVALVIWLMAFWHLTQGRGESAHHHAISPSSTVESKSIPDGEGATESRSAQRSISLQGPRRVKSVVPVSESNKQNSNDVDEDGPSLPSSHEVGNKTGASSSYTHHLATIEETNEFFKDILLIMMISPTRFHLVEQVKRHYSPFFRNIYFSSSRDNNSFAGIDIKGYDVVYGNEQYRAASKIIRIFEESAKKEERERFIGYLWLADDVILHPWALAGTPNGRVPMDRNVPWACQMGIGNLKAASSRAVDAVPGMSVQSKYRKNWPYWRKNKPKLVGAVNEGGEVMRQKLAESAKKTHPLIYKWSHYSRAFKDEKDLEWAAFYAIVDTYYIPKRLAIPYADKCDLMAKHWIMGECAIPTALRSISSEYLEMDVQFYWSTLKAQDCHRYKWSPNLDGFHRCRHDHPFALQLYDQNNRTRLFEDLKFRAEQIRL